MPTVASAPRPSARSSTCALRCVRAGLTGWPRRGTVAMSSNPCRRIGRGARRRGDRPRGERVMANVTVYTNVGSGPCHRATEYLSQKGVPFVEKNVGKDPQARQELMEIGLLSLPVILIGEQRLTGFNPAKIDEALATLG